MTAPSVVNDPNYGLISILSVLPWNGLQVVLFQEGNGKTNLAFFDASGNAIGRPVRFVRNGSGLVEFDFPGVSAINFITGPSGNVTGC